MQKKVAPSPSVFPFPVVYQHMRGWLAVWMICMCGGFLSLSAQNELDALRHSQSYLYGHPRALGMGGAYSAVGGDLSSATLNPAGLGVFRRSKFDFTVDYRASNTSARFIDVQDDIGRDNSLNVSALGFAFNNRFAYEDENPNGLLSYTFALGYQHKDNYLNRTIVNQAFNPFSSVTTSFAENVQGTNVNNIPLDSREELAFRTFMIDLVQNVPGDTAYFGAADRGQIYQSLQLLEQGLRREWYAAFGANVGNKIYFGLAATFEQLRYQQLQEIFEQDLDNVYDEDYPFNVNPDGSPTEPELDFVELSLIDTFSTTGNGFSATLGIIYRPTDELRLGFSAKLPTIFNLTDYFDTFYRNVVRQDTTDNMISDPVEIEFFDFAESAGNFSYQLVTPYRLTLGAMYLLGKKGFVSADVEYIDYTSSELRSNDFTAFVFENEAIQNQYQPTVNARLGGEARIDIFRLRAGFAYYGSPIRSEFRQYVDEVDFNTVLQTNDPRIFFTLGAGVRQPNFSFDVSFVNQRQQSKYNPYLIGDPSLFSPTLISTRNVYSIAASMGFAW